MKGIIGAICGDIIGSSREFRPIKTKDFSSIKLIFLVTLWLDKILTHLMDVKLKENEQ